MDLKQGSNSFPITTPALLSNHWFTSHVLTDC